MTTYRQGALDNGSQTPDEPLADSAPLAWAEAPRRCHQAAHADSCLWYHRVWQYMRLLGLVGAVRTNGAFLLDRFRDCARTGRYPSVLITGTADYSMLAHLMCAYSEQGGALEATVVDRCHTPLLLNRWYADRYGAALTTVAANLLEYTDNRQFDLVCTHNFLSVFDAESRGRLVARWHALLRPGGLVVTTQRIRPTNGPQRIPFTDQGARDFSSRVAAAARAFHQPLAVHPDELAEAVYRHAIRRRVFPIRTSREVTDLFDAQGFDIEHTDDGTTDERDRDRPAAPVGKDTYRMRIVARKR